MASTYTLKVELQGEIRRLKGWPAEGAEPAYKELQILVCEAFRLPGGSLHLQYRDDEGDLCTLEEATLPDALDLLKSSGSNVLRLFASHAEPLTSSWEAVPESLSVGLASEHDQAAAFEDVSSVTSVADEALEYGSAASPRSCPDTAASARFADAVSECNDVAETPLREGQGESGSAVRQRLEQAKPRLAQGMQRFKQQVTEDFQTARRDMKSAFDTEPGSSSERSRPLKSIRCAVGAVAGVAVAGRLVPLRATRLAAEAVAAVAGSGDSEAALPPAGAPEPVSGSTPEATPSSSVSTAVDAGVGRELAHFTEQVKQDFEVARQEIRDAFGCVMGTSSSRVDVGSDAVQGEDEQQTQPLTRQSSQLKVAVPMAASNLAGVTVAATLVPLRAVRLAVAAGRAAMTGAGAGAGADASTDASTDAFVFGSGNSSSAAATALAEDAPTAAAADDGAVETEAAEVKSDVAATAGSA